MLILQKRCPTKLMPRSTLAHRIEMRTLKIRNIVLAITLSVVGAQAQPAALEVENPKSQFTFTHEASPPDEPLTLWYRRPATKWETEALPVGNGRLAAMVFGGIDHERIQFNEESVWDGMPGDVTNPEALIALPEVRRLLFEGKNEEATKLAGEKMMGNPMRVKSYQTLGDLVLDMPVSGAVSEYRRELNLDTGVADVSYRIGGVLFTREVFASAPDQIIVIHIKADHRGKVNFTAKLKRNGATSVAVAQNRLAMRGQLGLKYEAQLQANARGGRVSASEGLLKIENADEVTLLLVGATSYKNANDIAIRPFGQTKLRLGITAKGRTLYLHVFSWPADGQLVVEKLNSPANEAYLLSDSGKHSLPVKQVDGSLIITVATQPPSALDSVIVMEQKSGTR